MLMNNIKYLKLIFLFFVFFSLQNVAIAAETIPTQIPDLEEQVDISITPKYPLPNETVVITLDAYGIDLNESDISWSNGDKTLLEGKGEKVLKTVAGNAGRPTIITATINPPNSRQLKRTITINPQSVDILWESNTYTPPFYKGKAMFTPQETVKLIAIPNQIDPKNAVYKWTENGEVFADRSGFGKNTFKHVGDIIARTVDFVVNVSDANKTTAENYISMAPVSPEVYIYEDNSRYGVLFNKELSTLFDIGTRQEGSVSIYPYFYGSSSRNAKNLDYRWTLNNITIDVPSYQNDMTFRNKENVDGKSIIGITVTNTDNFLQEIQKATLINFKKSSDNIEF